MSGGRLIDGPSLLWRCQLLGHVPPATDPESPPVASLATPLLDEVPFTFLGAHVALALATAGDADGLRRLAHNAASFEVPGAAELLPDLALGLAAYVEGDHARSADALLRLEPHFGRLGGSHAQREVFEDTVVHALIRAGRARRGVHPAARPAGPPRQPYLDTGLLARAGGARDTWWCDCRRGRSGEACRGGGATAGVVRRDPAGPDRCGWRRRPPTCSARARPRSTRARRLRPRRRHRDRPRGAAPPTSRACAPTSTSSTRPCRTA